MRNTGLIVLVVGFCVGIGWRSVQDLPIEVSVWLLVVALAVGLVRRRKGFAFSPPYQLLLGVFFTTCALGIIRTEVSSWQFNNSPLESELNEKVELTGIVVQEPDVREKTTHLYIKTATDKILVTTDRLGEYFYGDKVLVTGKLKRPQSFVTDLGREFNYVGYLQARGVEYSVSFAEVKVLETGLGNTFIAYLLQVKKRFVESIQSIIPEPAVGLGNGLLLGVKSALGDDIEEDFRQTGIIHIVVLSGYNVMLVVAFIMFVFSFFLPLRLKIVTGIVAIVSFALIVGLSATVVRASVMAGLVLCAQAFGRRYDVLRALLLAGLVMVLINPYLLIYDIGFQLSFMATLGLILIIPQFETNFVTTKSWFGMKGFFLATVATQIAVLPLLMYHIGEVSVISVVVNMLVLPIVPVAMFLTFITGVVGMVSVSIASLVGYLANLSLVYILEVAGWFATLPFASVTVPQFSALGVLIMYGVMIGAWFYFKNYRQETDDLAGWVIEEETEKAGEVLNVSSKTSPAKPEEVPVFFR